MLQFSDFLLKIGCAFLTGALIGIERQYRQRNAGLRTNILVATGAATFTVLSYAMTSSSGDPSRMAAQIISGIGFLGGGLILKDGVNVRGLNTAATIWCSAACGTLSGSGLYAEAFVLVGCVLFTHIGLRTVCRWIEQKTSGSYLYSIQTECRHDLSGPVQQTVMNTLAFHPNIKLCALFYKSNTEYTTVYCHIRIQGEHKASLDQLITRIRALPGVYASGWKKEEPAPEDF